MAEKILNVETYVFDNVIKKIKESEFLGLNTSELITLFIIAMAIGCHCKKRKPLQHKRGLIRQSAIHDDEMSLLKTVCLYDLIENNGDFANINNIEYIFKIVEEYANFGFHELEKKVNNFENTDKDNNLDVWESLDDLNNEYKKLFEVVV